MKTYLFFRVVLAFHIAGVVIMAGTTLIDYLTYKTFWKLADAGDIRSLGLVPLMARYGSFVRAGAIMIISTGVMLTVEDRGVIWGQPWFRVKMALVVILVLNGILVGSRQGNRLRDMVTAHAGDLIPYTTEIRVAMNRFYPLQLTLFFLIILISVVGAPKVKSDLPPRLHPRTSEAPRPGA